MDFVKKEDQNVIDEESHKLYMESLQKAQMETEYQHAQLSVEQLHQVMQNSLGTSSLAHNFQIPLSPRQMSTLMLKTNHITRNLNFNDIQSLQRNLVNEMDLVHNLANDIPQNLNRDDIILNRNLDFNLSRNLGSDLDLQNSLTHSLVQSLSDQELARTLSSELSQNLHRVNDMNLQHLRHDNVHMNHEIDLSHHLNRHSIEQELMNHDEARHTPVDLVSNHLIDQNLAQTLAHRIDQNLVQRLDPGLAQKLTNAMINENHRQFEQAIGNLPMPFLIKSEQDDDGYYYENVNPGLASHDGVNNHIPVEHSQGAATLHAENQIYAFSNSQTVPALNPIEVYSRPHNFVQNFVRENPENLVVQKFDSQYPEKFDKRSNEIKDGRKEEPKENLKPADQNKLFFTEYQNAVGFNEAKNENVSNSKPETEDLSLTIKGEYVCYKCQEIFPTKRGLKQHAKSCTEHGEEVEKLGKFKCPQCPYRCQSPAILKIHERTHTGEKPFSCTFCDYKSGQKNNVAKHILVHMKEKPYRCQYCDYRCAQKNNLVVHERTHTGFKPFGCPHCDYRTVQKPNLVKHMYLHTDQKPFSCDICNYRCVQKTNLTKHRQKHVNERMENRDDGKGAKPYKPRLKSLSCPHCSYRCVQKCSLIKHIQFKHIDLPKEDNQGLNLIRNENVCDGMIQNLSVKKDSNFADLCEVTVTEPLRVQS